MAFAQHNHAIKYAFMPNKSAAFHPLMVRLPGALRECMREKGHTQKDVEKATGVSQPQISKVLKGLRKRPTEDMRKLCLYASIENVSRSPNEAELLELLHKVVAGHPEAAECVRGILQNLAILTKMGSSIPGGSDER